MVLPPRRDLDAGRYIHAGRPRDAYGFADVFGRQSAGDEYVRPQVRRDAPIKRASAACARVEQECTDLERPHALAYALIRVAGIDANPLDYAATALFALGSIGVSPVRSRRTGRRPMLPRRRPNVVVHDHKLVAIIGRLAAVQLHPIQPHVNGRMRDFVPRLVHEYADNLHASGGAIHNLARPRTINAPRRFGEHQPEHVRARSHGRQRVLDVRDPADFHERAHASIHSRAALIMCTNASCSPRSTKPEISSQALRSDAYMDGVKALSF